MLIKPLDLVIIIPAIAVVVFSFFTAYSSTSSKAGVIIKNENNEWIFPLDTIETIAVQGPLGDTIIEINSGSARVIASPCKNQTCAASGKIKSQGQWLACLPNKVMLYISMGKNNSAGDLNEVDAATW
jgi:hypothetical protein